MTERIFTLAKALGHVGAEDEETLRQLCELAAEELRGRLRRGVTEADCEPAFRIGAAWLALAGLCAGGAAEGVESFTAGNLTIRQGGGKVPLERCAGLRRQAEQVMGPYLEDGRFSFRGVPG